MSGSSDFGDRRSTVTEPRVPPRQCRWKLGFAGKRGCLRGHSRQQNCWLGQRWLPERKLTRSSTEQVDFPAKSYLNAAQLFAAPAATGRVEINLLATNLASTGGLFQLGLRSSAARRKLAAALPIHIQRRTGRPTPSRGSALRLARTQICSGLIHHLRKHLSDVFLLSS